MATTTRVPVEVYLCSSYEPDAEYVDGLIEERPMGKTTTLHGKTLFVPGSGNTAKNGTCVSGRTCVSRSLQRASVFPMSLCLTVLSRGNRLRPNLLSLCSRFYRRKTP
jgi:hypothetical protein